MGSGILRLIQLSAAVHTAGDGGGGRNSFVAIRTAAEKLAKDTADKKRKHTEKCNDECDGFRTWKLGQDQAEESRSDAQRQTNETYQIHRFPGEVIFSKEFFYKVIIIHIVLISSRKSSLQCHSCCKETFEYGGQRPMSVHPNQMEEIRRSRFLPDGWN